MVVTTERRIGLPHDNLVEAGRNSIQRIPNDGKEKRASVGQRDRPRPAAKQRPADVTFEKPDLVTDRGRRDADLACGLRKAQMPGASLEGASWLSGGRWRMEPV
ncbi:MAG: hypothetical protein U1E19_01025 [Rhodoblastus sp.]